MTFTVGIYQPVSNGKVIPGVTVVGTIGVWHLLCSDFSTTQQEILVKMEDCAWNIQPEKENFILTELSIGTPNYLSWVCLNLFHPPHMQARLCI